MIAHDALLLSLDAGFLFPVAVGFGLATFILGDFSGKVAEYVIFN